MPKGKIVVTVMMDRFLAMDIRERLYIAGTGDYLAGATISPACLRFPGSLRLRSPRADREAASRTPSPTLSDEGELVPGRSAHAAPAPNKGKGHKGKGKGLGNIWSPDPAILFNIPERTPVPATTPRARARAKAARDPVASRPLPKRRVEATHRGSHQRMPPRGLGVCLSAEGVAALRAPSCSFASVAGPSFLSGLTTRWPVPLRTRRVPTSRPSRRIPRS